MPAQMPRSTRPDFPESTRPKFPELTVHVVGWILSGQGQSRRTSPAFFGSIGEAIAAAAHNRELSRDGDPWPVIERLKVGELVTCHYGDLASPLKRVGIVSHTDAGDLIVFDMDSMAARTIARDRVLRSSGASAPAQVAWVEPGNWEQAWI